MSTALTRAEAAELQRCEAIIEGGLQTFIEVGTALMTIRDKDLYKRAHGTFEDYCRDRFSLARSTAYQLIDAVKVVENVRHGGQTEVLPTHERQVRPLTSLAPEDQREAWSLAVASAPNGKPTAKVVEAAVREVLGGPAPPSSKGPLPGQATFLDEETEILLCCKCGRPSLDELLLCEECRFVCDECGEVFDQAVWHCPACDHHWPSSEDVCKNCRSNGDTVHIPAHNLAPEVDPSEKASEAWINIIRKHCELVSSIRRRGGIVRLCKNWQPERIGLAIEGLEEMRSVIDGYIEQLKERFK